MEKIEFLIFVVLIQFMLPVISGQRFTYAIIEARNKTQTVKECVAYSPDISYIPEGYESDDEKFYKLLINNTWTGCDGPDTDFYDRIVVIPSNNACSYMTKGINAEHSGANGLILATGETLTLLSQYHHLNLSLAFMREVEVEHLLNLGEDAEARFYSMPGTRFDLSLIVLWLIAIVTVIIGSYWSGITKHRIYTEAQFSTLNEGDSTQGSSLAPKETASINLTIKSVIFVILGMCTFLLLLYFFYSYLVYGVIALYSIACVCGVYQCFIIFIERLPCGTCKCPPRHFLCIKGHIELRELLLILFSIGIVVVWFVFRKEPWSWILQDILGICFGINLINTLRIPSLKICTVLLSLLFFYDIFFVFITPFLTKPKLSYQSELERSKVMFGYGGKGESIMVEVATGGSEDGEQLPMVFKVPHLSNDDYKVCMSSSYSFLGYGDVLVPGFLVAYCHGFDKLRGTPKKLYFVSCVIAYGVGLILTFIALMLMAVGQPALLYIVPSCLIPIFIIALLRKEFKAIWEGHSDPVAPASTNNCDIQANS